MLDICSEEKRRRLTTPFLVRLSSLLSSGFVFLNLQCAPLKEGFTSDR